MIPKLDVKILRYALSEKQVLISMISSVSDKYLHPQCAPLWRIIKHCFGKYKEVPTERVLEQTSGDGWSGISELYKHVILQEVDIKEYPIDLEELKKRYNEQVLRQAGEDVYKNNFTGSGFKDLLEANKTLKKAITDVDRIYTKEVFKEGSLSEKAPDAWETYKRIKANPEEAAGVRLGFKELDRITNGMKAAELMLIGGESGTGKSALTMNMCLNAWLGKNKVPTKLDEEIKPFVRGHSVVYFTVEMPFDSLQRRLHAALAGIPLYGIRDGNLSSEEEERYQAALNFVKYYPWPFYVVDIPRGATMRTIEVKYLELCQKYDKYPPELFGLDYISLISSDAVDGGSDWLNVGRVAEQAHEFCRVYNIPGISPVQLNRKQRKKGGEDERPDQDRIGRSSMLTQNANIVLTIEKRKDEHLTKDMLIHIIKMRDGEQGVFSLEKRLDIMRLYDSIDGWNPEIYEEEKNEK